MEYVCVAIPSVEHVERMSALLRSERRPRPETDGFRPYKSGSQPTSTHLHQRHHSNLGWVKLSTSIGLIFSTAIACFKADVKNPSTSEVVPVFNVKVYSVP